MMNWLPRAFSLRSLNISNGQLLRYGQFNISQYRFFNYPLYTEPTVNLIGRNISVAIW